MEKITKLFLTKTKVRQGILTPFVVLDKTIKEWEKEFLKNRALWKLINSLLHAQIT